MNDYLTLGSTPASETCVQVGHENYGKICRVECRVYRQQLERILAKEFNEIVVPLVTKSFPHDFGTYHEIAVLYDPNNKEQVKQSFWLDNNTPDEWDDEAKKYLEEAGYVVNELF